MSSTDGSGCILVVDDDDDIREAVVEILRDEGYAAEGKADGASALELLRDDDRDVKLVLLDWNMAPMSGLELVQALERANVKIPPLVVFTADAPKDKMARVGAVGFLKKPVPLDELYSYAAAYCRHP
jgi:CheY-like chemotaxis protein